MIQDNPGLIDPTLNELKKNFLTHVTKDPAFRKQQLKSLARGLVEMKQELYEALQKDLGYRCQFVANISQLESCQKNALFDQANVESWSKNRYVDTPLLCLPGTSYIKPEPFGVVLVMGAWNYPFETSITPMTSVIAAGNAVVLKPSEMSPHCALAMEKLFNNYLDRRFYRVINGGVEVAKAITTRRWDMIVFTGGPEKGKLVAMAAAKNLVPCILELGGKSPCIVDGSTDLEICARRIIHTKFFNNGQTCISPDYVLVQKDLKKRLLELLKQKVEEFYSTNPKESAALCSMINEFHTERVLGYLKDCGGTIVVGGSGNPSQKFIAPTIVDSPRLDSSLMLEEIFGPVLPVVTYEKSDDAITFINSREKPLALYYYGTNESFKEQIVNQTSSGGITTNDCIFHGVNPNLPFGGVGNSGYGSLHGKNGFDSCSHMKAVLEKSPSDGLMARYPPYTDGRKKIMVNLTKLSGVSKWQLLKVGQVLAASVIVYLVVKNTQQQDL